MELVSTVWHSLGQLRWINAPDPALNIDLIRTLGTSRLKSHGCSQDAPEVVVGYLTTEGQIVTIYDPSSLLRVKQRPRTRHCGPVDRSNCSERQERATCVVGGQEHSGTGYYVFTMGTGHSRPPSRRNDRDTHHTLELRPRGFAQPSGKPSPAFLPTAGSRQAQTTQHSQPSF